MATQEPNQPTHTLWQVIEGDDPGGRSFFRSIGAAWPNKKGTGFNIVLEAVPLSGRIAMTERKLGEGPDTALSDAEFGNPHPSD